MDAAERLALDWASEHSWDRIVIWGDDVRELAAAVRELSDDAEVMMWNDLVGPGIDGVGSVADNSDADVVIVRLPKSLSALDAWTDAIARSFPSATLVATGMIKHMTFSQNAVLKRHYAQLDISRARQKARMLIASDALPGVPPIQTSDVELGVSAGAAAGLRIVAIGGVFAGASLDIGTRALLDALNSKLPPFVDGELAVDLGSGSGIIAAWLARRGYRVRASDRSLAAVQSTKATAEANGLNDLIEVVWEDALAAVEPGSLDLIVLNPPFHDGTTVTVDPAQRLFVASARALALGGRLVTVWNSHLRYRQHLENAVGPTEQWARTPKFTVTVSTKR